MENKLDENTLYLTELYVRKGRFNDEMFDGDVEKKRAFFRDNGLRLIAEEYEDAGKKYNIN